MMSEKVYDVPADWAKRAYVDEAKYNEMYARSVKDPDGFWLEQTKTLDWTKAPTKAGNWSFAPGNISIKWFEDGVLNASYNCIDRHLEKRGDQVAIIFEGDDPGVSKKVTYNQLHQEVCKFANVLKAHGVKKGDRVTIYLPMILEAAYAILACARIGAPHSVVFGGFSPDSLAGRIKDAASTIVITADEGLRGSKKVGLKDNADAAADKAGGVKTMIVVRHTGGKVNMQAGRDIYYDEAVKSVSADCPCEPMNAEDPLFLLYTSGSTGQPKGVLHTTAGYLLHVSLTHKYTFDYHDGDIYWCTADIGWVTGHSYIIYGPLANGATTLMFEGIPPYPDISRFWNVVDKHQVNIFYTAPTAIRSLMQAGDAPVKKTSRKSLRLLGSVGEPINPKAWLWYHRVIGGERCPVVDTWWQTETGAIMITPLPGITATKPGSATTPFPGIEAEVVGESDGEPIRKGQGVLLLTRPWPSMLRTLYREKDRFVETYFSRFGTHYLVGDAARRDEDGYFWVIGRSDDAVNVSGHLLSTAEVESAIVAHDKVAEAAVIGQSDEDTGQAVCAFVTLAGDTEPGDDLVEEIRAEVAKHIGKFARPKRIIWADELPKTRSGKIMRRLLRDIAEGRALGDVTTLRDPDVMAELEAKIAEEQAAEA
jgi:acetyl-CoA synthetase